MQPDGYLFTRRRLQGAGRPQPAALARLPERAQRADAARAVLAAGHGAPVGEQAPRGARGGQPRHHRPPRAGEAPLPQRGAHQRDLRALDHPLRAGLTATGASAARSYWESGRAAAAAAEHAPPDVTIPVGFTTFPDEIFRAPRSWVEASYPTLKYFNEADKGGHFAAWEEPELFATEVRAAFRSLR